MLIESSIRGCPSFAARFRCDVPRDRRNVSITSRQCILRIAKSSYRIRHFIEDATSPCHHILHTQFYLDSTYNPGKAFDSSQTTIYEYAFRCMASADCLEVRNLDGNHPEGALDMVGMFSFSRPYQAGHTGRTTNLEQHPKNILLRPPLLPHQYQRQFQKQE